MSSNPTSWWDGAWESISAIDNRLAGTFPASIIHRSPLAGQALACARNLPLPVSSESRIFALKNTNVLILNTF